MEAAQLCRLQSVCTVARYGAPGGLRVRNEADGRAARSGRLQQGRQARADYGETIAARIHIAGRPTRRAGGTSGAGMLGPSLGLGSTTRIRQIPARSTTQIRQIHPSDPSDLTSDPPLRSSLIPSLLPPNLPSTALSNRCSVRVPPRLPLCLLQQRRSHYT